MSLEEFQSPSHSSLLCTHLSRYTAAVSYKKMARRFNNKNLSIPYFKSLEQVKNRDIPFMSQLGGKRADNDRFGRDEVNNDRRFLKDFVALNTNRLIPNLINMVNNLPPDGEDSDFQLYTNETSAEFHLLLLLLLTNFKKALDDLVICQCQGGKNEDQVVASDQANEFNRNVGKVYIYGYALLRISRGRAFQMHLENIKTLLKPEGLRTSANVGASIEGDEIEIDEELETIQSESSLPQKDSDGKGSVEVLHSLVAADGRSF
jgi:hypothetical protein